MPTTGRRTGPWTMRVAAAVPLAVALTVNPAAAHAAAGAPAVEAGPVAVAPPDVLSQCLIGSWLAHVVTSLPSSGDVSYAFRVDGTLRVTAGGRTVDGTWKRGPGSTFSFAIHQELRDASGNLVALRDATQAGSLADVDHFSSTGTTVDRDLSGNVIRTFQVDVTAVRE
jgi:hypothetical protein